MKYSVFKNIILAVIPVLIFYSYQQLQIALQREATATFNNLPVALFNVLAPFVVGVFLFCAIVYAYTNRNSLVFISLFCGGLLLNILYVISSLGLLGPSGHLLTLSAAPQIAFVLTGAYLIAFWVSLICYIRGRKSRRDAGLPV